MRTLVVAVVLIAASLGTASGQTRSKPRRIKGVAVAFFDQERLQSPAGQAALEEFKFFFNMIREIVKQDFPDLELKTLGRGQLLRLPDGTGLNVQTMRPELGYVFSAPGNKRLVLSGVQSDSDFACAAASFFRQPSPSCPK
jgi:hypothetical protein